MAPPPPEGHHWWFKHPGDGEWYWRCNFCIRWVGAEYDTFRPALAPFVVGLLHGLAGMVGTPIEVDHVQAKGDEHDADVFKIRFVSA